MQITSVHPELGLTDKLYWALQTLFGYILFQKEMVKVGKTLQM